MLPRDINFPNNFDDENTLYVVKDSLRVKLEKDYSPGDATVYAEENVNSFPPTGIITLVDHNDAKNTVSMHYGKRESNYFTDLEILPDSILAHKTKEDTLITMQVVANHHNAIKDALIGLQKYVGTLKDTAKENSLFAKINRLKEIVFKPKAWFEASKVKGMTPLTVVFKSTSTGTEGPVGNPSYEWNFGDGDRSSEYGNEIIKTYNKPGKYTVSLKIMNDYGEDEIVFNDMITALVEAPEEAKIKIKENVGQVLMPDGRLRTPINQFIEIEIPQGEDEERELVSYAGEQLDLINKNQLDPIIYYTWQISDDVPHQNSPISKAIYSIGGTNDITVRVDTQNGAYRITNYKDKIDVVENTNLWLWTFNNKRSVSANEFGLFSETFKTKFVPEFVKINSSFLQTDDVNKSRQLKEFMRNNGFARRSNTPSGSQGTCLLFWASGRNAEDSVLEEKVLFKEYKGFTDTYTTPNIELNRPWNWAPLVFLDKVYFILGNSKENQMPTLSLTNQQRDCLDLGSMTLSTDFLFKYNYVNGAQDLQINKAEFDEDGSPKHGHFSSYRTAWCNGVGYVVRNSDTGDNHYLKSFYKTEGTLGRPFLNIGRLPEVPGENKTEGQLVAMSDSVYFFNNSGTVYSYSEYRGTWEVAGPIAEFRSVPDPKNHKNDSESFLAASNGGRKAYLSFDYNNKMFVRFNELNMTFTTLNSRPEGDQWLLGIY